MEWISVKKIMPEEGVECFVWDGAGTYLAKNTGGRHPFTDDVGELYGITHWTPLPEPPKESV